jgi:hypothetical protein
LDGSLVYTWPKGGETRTKIQTNFKFQIKKRNKKPGEKGTKQTPEGEFKWSQTISNIKDFRLLREANRLAMTNTGINPEQIMQVIGCK